ncbi:MAG: acyl-CoA dehydrogenase family protein, partial [Nitriliruptorales bacterium]|nr:acyl-CoA dehydrogenase family protein [Nitriliruptorales bacterium]
MPDDVLDPAALQAWLDEPHADIRSMVRDLLDTAEFAPVGRIPKEEHREIVLGWARRLAEEGGTTLGFPTEYGGGGNVGGSIAAFETMAHGDLSLLVKVGVQFGLFGGAILHLGTKPHHDTYLRDLMSLELPGCFAMTETGHGSDVQRIGTTATYVPEDDEFEIHTPDDRSRKDYIGNAAAHGRAAAVFAQLIVDGTNHGVHCLVVPIRNKKGKVLDGVRIEDCGDKLGLHG